MNTPMKILQVTNYYFPFIGGIEQVTRDCSDALKGEHEVKVFCFNHEKGDKIDEVDGVEIIRAGCFAKVASQSLSFSYGKLLKKTLREFAPDVVIFHYPNPFAAHFLLKRLKRYPNTKLIIYWHLDIYKQKFLKKFFHGQNIRLCRRALYVLGATRKHLDDSEYYEYFWEKCREIPYGIDINKLEISPEAKELAKEIKNKYAGKTICFAMGRLVPYKGMEYLIRAAKYLNRLGETKYEYFIAGTGPLEESLQELAADEGNIHLLGKIDNTNALAYREACDIFCFPSITRNECFGLALAEAMYFGKPAITFTIPHSGVNCVSLNGVTGIEVENRNIVAYADAIKLMAEDSELRKRYGNAARQRVIDNFTFKKFKENMIHLMEETLR